MEDSDALDCVQQSLFSSLYKYSGKNAKISQQRRRELLLKEQKENRQQSVDTNRQLCTLVTDKNEHDDMECEAIGAEKKYVKFKLMESEWLTEIPDDLEENWLVKFGPEGFRVLLVAKKHSTICYNDRGRVVLNIRSHFPGGGADKSNGTTILDCIYNKTCKTIFVLDCLFWNTMSMLDSEVSFRFYWLKSKFQENPLLQKSNKMYNLVLMDYLPAHKPLIQDEMWRVLNVENHPVYFDGVVFYHKESHYTFGPTPLVGWLASFMLPEKLNIDVLPQHMVKKPEDYVCLQQYLEDFIKKKTKKREKNKMDTC